MKAIDLFCGCGGIASGLESAGFEIIAGVDVEKKYIQTFRHNFPNAKALLANLNEITASELMRSVNLKEGELKLLAGGPPCQGFSKNVPRKERVEDSSNNLLINTYLEYCAAMLPEMILMENVAEMKNGFGQYYTDKIYQSLESLGYKVTTAILHAAEYGVPQRRRRAFFLAHRDGVKFDTPKATHIKPKENDLFQNNHFVNVWAAISDLPPLNHGEVYTHGEYPIQPENSYQKWARCNSKKITNHEARPLRAKQFARIASLKPGQGLKDLPAHLQIKSGYSGAYGRLTKDMIAPTITRWVFHPGSGRWGHPVDKRLITIREIARLQSFPDTFEFVGSYTDKAGQLGNAVPPLLAYQIAKSMIHQSSSNKAVNSFKDNRLSSDAKENAVA